MNSNKKYFFIGIGGIGMSSIARYYNNLGNKIMGYDRVKSDILEMLSKEGIKVFNNTDISLIPDNFRSQDVIVIYTSAISQNNLYLKYFISNNNKIFKRSEILGKITENTFCIAVAGTHGKTTTSAILTHLFYKCEESFQSFVGGILKGYETNFISTGSKYSIVEADEYDRSFLQLKPQIGMITSIEKDHLDIYGDFKSLKETFNLFTNNISGTIFYSSEIEGLEGLSYSINSKTDYYARNISVEKNGYRFDLIAPNNEYINIEFNQIGSHNLLNAVGAFSIAHYLGLDENKLIEALADFKGVNRRMDVFRLGNKIVIDDYAHHPSEIKACYHALKRLFPMGKIVAAFQPHLFSRTQDFADDFAKELSQFDEVVLLDIYPARELPIEGVTSDWLSSKMTTVVHRAQLNNCVEMLTNIEAQVYVTIGAGSIGTKVKEITNKLKEI